MRFGGCVLRHLYFGCSNLHLSGHRNSKRCGCRFSLTSDIFCMNFRSNLQLSENINIYNAPAVADRFPEERGWVNGAEELALTSIADLVRGKRILDIGVGLGRTVSLLRLLSDGYVGIDYSIERVKACQERHPGVDVRPGDACRLSEFEDGSFDFVFFSFNGLDSIAHEGRAMALREIARVLTRDGIALIATLNKNGPSCGETPWQLHRPGRATDVTLHSVVSAAWINLIDPMRLWRRTKNWLAAQRKVQTSDDWSMRPLAALDFALMHHFVTLGGLRNELKRAGFEVVRIYENEHYEGRIILETATDSVHDGFHAVVRRQIQRN
jgi:SAM-dependent methyltransferase